jgi:hypothetical protein
MEMLDVIIEIKSYHVKKILEEIDELECDLEEIQKINGVY